MTPTEPAFFDLTHADGAEAAAAAEAAAGLARTPAAIAPKFFYDVLGSRLFDAITALPEYYPTRTEAAIVDGARAAIAAAVRTRIGAAPVLLDLGAGNGEKAAGWFEALAPARYVAVDISGPFLREALTGLARRFPALPMAGVALDFSEHLELPAALIDRPALMHYPGSSIGNFGPDEALALLARMRQASRGGALLIGADLVKPAAVLEAAYDDALGMTAAFNLNVLRRMNALLGADFDVAGWRHVALYDARAGRIEMHLEARHDVRVAWRGGGRAFAAGERIHTENSYKWQRGDFEALLRDAGWRDVACWTDERDWFGVFLACA